MSSLVNSAVLAAIEKLIDGRFSHYSTLFEWRLKCVENISQEELSKYQLSRFRFIAEKASKLPFYGRIFREQGVIPRDFCSFDNLVRLPVLYKADFRKYPESNYVDFELGKSRGYWVQTSGSTGEPFRLMRDKKYLSQVKAFNLQIFKWFDIDINSKKANFIVPWGSPSAWGNPDNDKYLTVDNFQNKVEEYANFLEWFKPIVLESNPSHLVYFAHYLTENKRKLHIPYLLSYGEQLFDKERKLLEETFRGDVINRYGITELTNIGVECPAHEGFHLNSLGCFIEIVDDKGYPVSNNKEGEIVITSFINEVTPILRYGTGDRGRWIKKSCSCGRTYPLFRVEGRRDDFLKLGNGRIIYMNFFHPIFYKHMDKVKQFQIIQETKSRVAVRLVPTSLFNKETENDITGNIKELLGKGIRVKLFREKSIPWLKSGKYKSVIRL